MARPGQEMRLSAHHAAFVLEKALADRKLSAADVRRYLSVMHEEILELEARLASLKSAAVEPVRHFMERGAKAVKRVAHDLAAEAPFVKSRKRRKKVSAEVAASQKLQGQYLGYMRQIAKAKRPFYQKISKANGREAAIAAMKKTLGK